LPVERISLMGRLDFHAALIVAVTDSAEIEVKTE
jgi:hypothetical protein